MSRRFAPGWRMTAFVLMLLPLLLTLGGWQLRRAAQKEAIEVAAMERAALLVIGSEQVAASTAPAQLAFRRVRLQGHYLGLEYYLIDNQVRQGQVGYWIVHRFQSADGRFWLVNRGFVASGGDRAVLPRIATPAAAVTLVATVWPQTGLVPLLREEPTNQNWPRRVQRLDLAALSRAAPGAVPLELRLDATAAGALEPLPLAFSGAADRHRGYAVQWFGLAAVLLIAWLVFGFGQPARRNAAAREQPQDMRN